MDRYKNNTSNKKDMSGVKNKTDKLSSFTKGMTSTSATKNTSPSTGTNNYRQFYEKPKPDRTTPEAHSKKKDQNLIKPASQSVTSYNNSNQQPTKNENKIVKPKQDQIHLGVFYKGDWSQSKASQSVTSYNNNKQQPTKDENKIVKPKQDQIHLGVSYKGDQNQSKASQSVTSYNNSKQQPTKIESKTVMPKQDQIHLGLSHKGDQSQSKASQSVTSYSNSKQQPTKSENKIVKPKEDQIHLGVFYKGDQNQSKVLNYDKVQKPSHNDFGISKSKQDEVQVWKKPEPNVTKISNIASQTRDDRKYFSSVSKTSSHSQDNKKNETGKREKLFADYAANIALVRTMKHMWQSPKKGKDANPMKSLSYVASVPKNLKYKPDERVDPNFGARSYWEEQATSVPENFLPGQSKQDVKVNDKAAEAIGTETFSKSNQSFQSAKLKAESQVHDSEDDLQNYLLKEPALTALYIGFPADQIKQAIKEKIRQTGTPFTSTRELIEAVSKLKKESQEKTLEKDAPEVNVVGREEEIFVDRKVLEEIKTLKEEKMCKICLDSQVGIVFVPCGHLLACVKCSENIKTCPLCRAEIQSTIKTFLS